MDIASQLQTFKHQRSDYAAFAKLLAGFLDAKIDELQGGAATLPLVHSITNRVKTVESLKRKLERKFQSTTGHRKPKQKDVPMMDDLAGVRVTFYFKDDMEAFLKNDFETLFGKRTKESVDEKAKALDNFGYGSVHFTVTCTANSKFTESLREDDRTRFKDFRCEVQIRTILQHAWAETAHDIIYKKASETNQYQEEDRAQRLFNAMSATLELLDDRLVKQKRYPKRPPFTAPASQDKPNIELWVKNDARRFEYNGSTYPYLILHEGDLSEVSHEEDWQLYNSSKEFDIEHYKDTVWSQMKTLNRAFIESLYSYDSTIVRVKDWIHDGSKIIVQPALYSDQITTNHPNAHSCKLHDGRTVKDFAFKDEKLLDFSSSPFANSIGVACVIRTNDNYWVIGKRRAGISVFAERWSCPVSGIVEWRERGKWHPNSFEEWMTESMLLECDQEIGLQPERSLVKYLGMARETQRLGKPQLFFFIDLVNQTSASCSSSNIEARYKIYRVDNEFSRLSFIESLEVNALLSGRWPEVLKVTKGEAISSELLMNLALAHKSLAHS